MFPTSRKRPLEEVGLPGSSGAGQDGRTEKSEGGDESQVKHDEGGNAPAVFDGKSFYFTRLRGEPPRPELLSFEDLTSPRDQVTDLLCTAMYTDPEDWMLYELAELGHANIIMALDERWLGQANRRKVVAAMPEGPGARLVLGVYTSQGLMHAKLVLVRFKAFLRVCVASANLGRQWSCSREVLWVQDFRVPGGPGRPLNTAFYHGLTKFCRAIGVPPQSMHPIVHGVSFQAAGATLIPSVPPSTQRPRDGDAGDKATRGGRKKADSPPLLYERGDHGHIYLRQALHMHSWPAAARHAPVISVSGSIGDLDKAWLKDFNESLMGSSQGGATKDGAATVGGWPSTINILHPTNETIFTSSQVGLSTINLSWFYWVGEKKDGVPAPRHLFYDCREKDSMAVGGVQHPVHHMKTLLRAVPQGVPIQEGELAAWCYIGSHNLSRRAWGYAPSGHQGERKCPDNVELGVLLVTHDPRERDEWWRRFPLRLPGAGPDAARPYDLTLSEQEVRDRRDPRCPWTGGRAWDSVLKNGKTGRQLYREARESFWRAQGGGLPPDDVPEDGDDDPWRNADGQPQPSQEALQAPQQSQANAEEERVGEDDCVSGDSQPDDEAEAWRPSDHAVVTQRTYEDFSSDDEDS